MADPTSPPPAHSDATAHGGAEGTHATTEVAHGAEQGGGGLPQFEFQHWFGQIVYLIFLFALLYWLMAKVFVPRLRGVIDQRAATIADAVQTNAGTGSGFMKATVPLLPQGVATTRAVIGGEGS